MSLEVRDAGRAGLIDVHHHFNPTLRTNDGKAWSVEMALEAMDGHGIACAVASIGPVAVAADLREHTRNIARWNDWGAGVCREHAGRFGLMGALPLPDVEAALAEIAHIFDELRLDGVALSTSYNGVWLTDDAHLPVFEALDRHGAVVFVHPSPTAQDRAMGHDYGGPAVLPAWLEFPVHTARIITGLLTKGIARRFPRIRFVFAHGGGVMPLLLGRIAGFSAWHAVGPEKLREMFPDGVHAAFASFYFECAQACAPEAFAMLRGIVPDEHILFGSDFSYFPMAHPVEEFAALPLDPAARDLIGWQNAARLFPKAAGHGAGAS